MGALQVSGGESPLSCSDSCFWIATKKDLMYYGKLKLMVVYLNMTGYKLLWFIISEAAEQPQQLVGNWQKGGAGPAQSPWHRRHNARSWENAWDCHHSFGEVYVSCVLSPFTRYPLLATIEGRVLKQMAFWSVWLKFLLPTLPNVTSDDSSGMSSGFWKDEDNSVIAHTESPGPLAASGWHNEYPPGSYNVCQLS